MQCAQEKGPHKLENLVWIAFQFVLSPNAEDGAASLTDELLLAATRVVAREPSYGQELQSPCVA